MATVYLATTGSDSYTYAQAQNPATPWLTPGKVVSSATSGDTVRMAAGTYTWATVNFTGKTFTFIGAAIENGLPATILDAGGGQASWMYATNVSVSNAMFQNAIPNATYQIFFGGFNPTIGHFDFTQCVFRNLTLSTNGTSYAIFGSPGGGGIVSTMTSCLLYNLLGASAGNTNTTLS